MLSASQSSKQSTKMASKHYDYHKIGRCLILSLTVLDNSKDKAVSSFVPSVYSHHRQYHPEELNQGGKELLFGQNIRRTTVTGSALSESSLGNTPTQKLISRDDDSWRGVDDEWLDAFIGNIPGLETEHTDKVVVGPEEVLVYDTSLRDGTQGESISVSCDDKVKIAVRLAEFGVDFIECGWPGSNPKDAEFFSRASTELDSLTKSKLVAFGSTRRKGIAVENDAQIKALVDSEAPTICIVAKAHKWQVTEIIRADPLENIDMITDSVTYLAQDKGRRVFIDLEHFFDGFKFDREYTLLCCDAAVKAGVSSLVLCDTNGGSMPWEVEEMTRVVREHFPGVTVGIHAHNDCGVAVANSLSAVRGGAGLVQGTINGIGERTGNADLCSIVPSLALHMESKMTCKKNLEYTTKLSRFVDELLNRSPNPAAPYVGMSAFAHKGGLHVAAMERSPLSYQHVEPQAVGNEKRILISELSGRQNIIGKIEELGIEFGDKTSERATAILNRVKILESIGYTFEGADASVRLMILHASDEYCAPFRVLDYSAQVFDTNMDSASRILWQEADEYLDPRKKSTARATIKVRTVDETDNGVFIERLEVSDGSGPIDALASALKRCLTPSYELLNNIELVDYKVRILEPEKATAAISRVMIEFRDSVTDTTWTTVSVDANVISASLNALVDGFEYALLSNNEQEMCLLWGDQ